MRTSVTRTALHSNCQPRSRSFWAKLGDMLALRRQRNDLRQLDDHLLNDIGLTRNEAIKESKQHMWQVPNHWRK